MPLNVRNSIPKIVKIPVVKLMIDGFAEKHPDLISQINVAFSGDVEIRFNTEELMLKFLEMYSEVEVDGKKISIGRKVAPHLINHRRYGISFNISGGVEARDVVEALKLYGTIVDVSWKTIPGTPIRTGQITVYLALARAQIADSIPGFLNVGAQRVKLNHRQATKCNKCGEMGHFDKNCEKIKASA